MADGIAIYEMYEIHHTLPRKFNTIGYWNEQSGFVMSEDQKWVRRHDLEVKQKREKLDFINDYYSLGYKIENPKSNNQTMDH